MFSDPEKNIEQFGVDPGMTVADFGSGAGFYTMALVNAVGDSGKVIALDVQKELLEKLKNQTDSLGITNVEVLWADLDEPKGSRLANKTMDKVVVANTLFQIEDKDNFVEEVKRVLKSSGRLLLVDWMDSYGGLGPKPENVIKKDVAQVLFEENGFKLEREISAGAHHYGLVFKL